MNSSISVKILFFLDIHDNFFFNCAIKYPIQISFDNGYVHCACNL